MLRKSVQQLLRPTRLPQHISVATMKFQEFDPNEGNRLSDKIKREIEESKKTLAWRTPIGDRPGDWNSKLKSFADMEQTADYITMMQKPINLRPSAVKAWWERRKERTERFLQQYVSERHEQLGNELAAAHFIIFRGGSVKFLHEKEWKKSDEEGEYNLPTKFHPAWKVEAIKCDYMTLYYEGLENIRCLPHLKFLSFKNVKTFDDWCLDRVSGSEFVRLEVLDLTGTQMTCNGLQCLYRIPTLKLLILDDPKADLKMELSCALLEEAIPKLKIIPSKDIHGEIENNETKS
ncbi:distal membrane-arm assembly complex protein 2 [Episyrphus balteatus]|uniref:distal membrane-arm assembly complex protein 2 n=1 Tax=Episyrphus balteatus TaxID=286459 RepID=UPI0024856C44|nr:distal membrane-arm assembly complex protein 2 [Episyrphus balteatus]